MATVVLTVPEGREGLVQTSNGNYPIIGNQVTVDSRDALELIAAGFSNPDFPGLTGNDPVELETSLSGVIQGEGANYPIVAGVVTVPMSMARALLEQGSFSSVTVIGGGTPDNGFGSEGYFLSGEEVAQTTFFSSGYDAQYHTAEGMEIEEGETAYAPQLGAPLVTLLEQPHTIILDGEFVNSDSSKFYLLCDESNYFEYSADHNAIVFADNTFFANTTQFGVTSPPPIGRYRIALTHLDGSISVSVNGSSVVSDEADALPYSITTVVLGIRDGGKITEFTIMAPQDDATLPALSAIS